MLLPSGAFPRLSTLAETNAQSPTVHTGGERGVEGARHYRQSVLRCPPNKHVTLASYLFSRSTRSTRCTRCTRSTTQALYTRHGRGCHCSTFGMLWLETSQPGPSATIITQVSCGLQLPRQTPALLCMLPPASSTSPSSCGQMLVQVGHDAMADCIAALEACNRNTYPTSPTAKCGLRLKCKSKQFEANVEAASWATHLQ